MVEPLPSKQDMPVRSRSPAPSIPPGQRLKRCLDLLPAELILGFRAPVAPQWKSRGARRGVPNGPRRIFRVIARRRSRISAVALTRCVAKGPDSLSSDVLIGHIDLDRYLACMIRGGCASLGSSALPRLAQQPPRRSRGRRRIRCGLSHRVRAQRPTRPRSPPYPDVQTLPRRVQSPHPAPRTSPRPDPASPDDLHEQRPNPRRCFAGDKAKWARTNTIDWYDTAIPIADQVFDRYKQLHPEVQP